MADRKEEGKEGPRVQIERPSTGGGWNGLPRRARSDASNDSMLHHFYRFPSSQMVCLNRFHESQFKAVPAVACASTCCRGDQESSIPLGTSQKGKRPCPDKILWEWTRGEFLSGFSTSVRSRCGWVCGGWPESRGRRQPKHLDCRVGCR